MSGKKVLECSSKGDKRFSAMFAKVEVFGVLDTIENHYQSCKRDAVGNPVKKGQPVDHMVLLRRKLPPEMLTQWYKLLWIKYLRQHPKLVTYAAQFDEFTDAFRGKNTVNCQADVIRDCIKNPTQLMQSVSGLRAELMQIKKEVAKFQFIVGELIAAIESGSLHLEDLEQDHITRLSALLEV